MTNYQKYVIAVTLCWYVLFLTSSISLEGALFNPLDWSPLMLRTFIGTIIFFWIVGYYGDKPVGTITHLLNLSLGFIALILVAVIVWKASFGNTFPY